MKTDFPTRAKALAKEIDKDDPVLVGLQEVAWWRSGTLGDPAPATTTQFDFLTSLLAELNARGLHYAAVTTAERVRVREPGIRVQHQRLPGPQGRAPDDARRDPGAHRHLADPVQDLEPAVGELLRRRVGHVPEPGRPTAPDRRQRGWTSIDISVLGIPGIRFVNTHLESFSAAAHFGQAAELLQTPALNTNKAVVLVGDLNSDPAAGDATLPPAGAPDDGDAYRVITTAGQFKETGDTANTCCRDELLTNPTANFTERIDHPDPPGAERLRQRARHRQRPEPARELGGSRRPDLAVRPRRTGGGPHDSVGRSDTHRRRAGPSGAPRCG